MEIGQIFHALSHADIYYDTNRRFIFETSIKMVEIEVNMGN